MALITLLTDFGAESPYVAAMKGVILRLHRRATIVDLSHSITPQDVRQAALMLEQSAAWYPPGTIHLAVVDPGVGTDRALVYAEIGQQRYLAPDNGLLSLVAAAEPPTCLVRLADARFWLPEVSATFHGRDILAPVAARVALGLSPRLLGPPLPALVSLAWPLPRRTDDWLEGEIIWIDRFGNLVTNLKQDCLPPHSATARVWYGDEAAHWVTTYADRPAGSLVALVGSSGRLEIAVVNGSAQAHLGAHVGDRIRLPL